jgi:hypothetical protein
MNQRSLSLYNAGVKEEERRIGNLPPIQQKMKGSF